MKRFIHQIKLWLGLTGSTEKTGDAESLVRKQRTIQQRGIKVYAAVMDCKQSSQTYLNFVKVQLQLMILPAPGKFEEITAFAMVNHKELPANGDFVMVHYLPADRSLVTLSKI